MLIYVQYYTCPFYLLSTEPWFIQWHALLDGPHAVHALKAILRRAIWKSPLPYDLDLHITENLLGIKLTQDQIKKDIQVFSTFNETPHYSIKYP